MPDPKTNRLDPQELQQFQTTWQLGRSIPARRPCGKDQWHRVRPCDVSLKPRISGRDAGNVSIRFAESWSSATHLHLTGASSETRTPDVLTPRPGAIVVVDALPTGAT